METEFITAGVTTTETLKTIYERRAIRKYKEKPVDNELIEQILDAGRMAPSAINKQPWKFYVLTDEDTIRTFSNEIAKIAAKDFIKDSLKEPIKTIKNILHSFHRTGIFSGGDPIFHGAPVVIFITGHQNDEWAALDIGMCAQNMMLAAKSMGLDSCPIGLAKYVEQTNVFDRLRVPLTERVHLAVILGYGNEKPEAHERVKTNALFIYGDEKEK